MSKTLDDVRFHIYQLLAEMQSPLESDVLNAAFNSKFGSSIPYSKFGYPTLYDFLSAFLNDPNYFPDNAELLDSSVFTKYFIEKPIEVTVKSRIPLHYILLDAHQIFTNLRTECLIEDVTFITSQITAIKEQPHYLRLPDDILSKLNLIVKMNDGGISSSNLLIIYKFMFKQDLNYQRYKYATIEEMSKNLTDIFTCFRINNKLMLYHKDHLRLRYVYNNTLSSN